MEGLADGDGRQDERDEEGWVGTEGALTAEAGGEQQPATETLKAEC